MRLVENWQYKYIERSLFNYYKIRDSELETEKKMVKAINAAQKYFSTTIHEIMLIEFYFKADEYRKKLTTCGHFRYVCNNLLHTEEPNGYVIRREIVYRVAMMCYALGIFKLKI